MSTKARTRGGSAQRTSSSTTVTPQVPTSSSQVKSPMTPTRLSRIQEKNALANLNDRLAAYIDKNRQLEAENKTYHQQITHFEENSNKTITRLKSDYDREITTLRKLVDETAKDKNKLEHDFGTLKKDHDEMKAKFDKKTKDFNAQQKTLAQAEESIAQLQSKLSKIINERDNLAGEKKDLETELAKHGREINELRNSLEKESTTRVDAENKLRHKTEALEFANQIHQQEISEVKQRRQIEIQEVAGVLEQDYEAKLQQSLQELRDEYEQRMDANKVEMESISEQRYSDLRNQLKRTQSSLASKQEEISTLQMKLEAVSSNSAKFEQERNDLLKRIKDLEKKSDDDHNRFAKLLDNRDAEIEQLVREKSQLLTEYQDLMDTKVHLDNEIATYRKLLEVEETRLSLSPRSSKRGLTPSMEEKSTPLKAKRRRVFDEQTNDEAQYQVDNKKTGDISIDDDDVEGKFVKLCNTGDKEVSLSGWTLTRVSGDIETTHKFHRQMKLEPKGVVTVWSADAPGVSHDPPHNLVMKGQKWFASDNIRTVLHNNSNEEVAARVTKRSQQTVQRKRLGFGTSEDLFHQEGEEGQADRCVIC